MASRRLLTPDTAAVPQAAADGIGGADDTAVPPAPLHVVQWHLHGRAAVNVAIAGNVVVAALFSAAVIWRVFFTETTAGQEGAAVSPSPPLVQGPSSSAGALLLSSSASSTPPPRASPRSGGLGKADLLALPVYVHHGSSGEVGGAEETAAVECAVCLGELRDGETGRVLPRCGHRFHAECVDRWFRAHATCSLCRAVVVAADGGGSGKPLKLQPAGV